MEKIFATSTKGVVIVSCLAVALLSTICKASGPACDIPPVEIGETATLTCHYNEEVLRLQQKIIIIHYRSPIDENPETISFSSIFNGKIEYYTHPDYVLLTKNDVIQLQISRVAKNHSGRYACLVLQSNSFEECSFTPLDSSKLGQTNISRANETDSNHTISTFYSVSKADDYNVTVVILLTSVISALLITIGALSYLMYIKHKRNIEKEQKDNKKEKEKLDIFRAVEGGEKESDERNSLTNAEVSETPLLRSDKEDLENPQLANDSLASVDLL